MFSSVVGGLKFCMTASLVTFLLLHIFLVVGFGLSLSRYMSVVTIE